MKLGTGYLVAALVGMAPLSASAALVLDLQSANYNATTGVWTDSASGDNATAPSGHLPTLTSNDTPTGQKGVNFAGNQYLELTSALNSASFTTAPNLTIIAVAKWVPSASSQGAYAFVGTNTGATGGLSFREDAANNATSSTLIKQVLTKTNVVDAGTSNAATSANVFHLIDVTYNGTTAAFRLDQQNNSSTTGATTFTAGISRVGANSSSGGAGAPNVLWPMFGDIAALRVYDTALDAASLSAAETSLSNTYLTPEPGSLSVLCIGGLGLLARRRRRA